MDTADIIHRRLSKNGIAAINIISSYRGRNAQTVKNFYRAYQTTFGCTSIYPADPSTSAWTPQNFILVSQKNKVLQPYGLRYGRLDPPQDEVL
jgi:hypothetical protein